jgi:hypothetical protein
MSLTLVQPSPRRVRAVETGEALEQAATTAERDLNASLGEISRNGRSKEKP